MLSLSLTPDFQATFYIFLSNTQHVVLRTAVPYSVYIFQTCLSAFLFRLRQRLRGFVFLNISAVIFYNIVHLLSELEHFIENER